MPSNSRPTILMLVLALLLVLPAGAQEPAIHITLVPEYGSFVNDDLGGVVENADPALHHVGVYVGLQGLGWYIKPLQNQCVDIAPDGTWVADVVTGGWDHLAQYHIAFLLPIDEPCPNLLGVELPASLYDAALDFDRHTQMPYPIDFAGYTWQRRESQCLADPGPNLFDPDNVFLDAEGDLHLLMSYDGVEAKAAELDLTESLGYGRYRVLTTGRLDMLGDFAILGMFLFDPWTQAPFREIDTECGHFGDPNNSDCQFVVQPFDVPGNLFDVDGEFTDADTDRTWTMDWRPGGVDFCLYRGHHPVGDPPEEDEIVCWEHRSDFVPDEGDETFSMNLWAFDRDLIDQEYDVEVVDFAFEELPALELKLVDGICPGPATLELSGLTALGTVALLRGTAEGSVILPRGPCAGTEAGLADPGLLTTLTANAAGEALIEVDLPRPVCGRWLQALDIGTCEPSNTSQVPLP